VVKLRHPLIREGFGEGLRQIKQAASDLEVKQAIADEHSRDKRPSGEHKKNREAAKASGLNIRVPIDMIDAELM